jgi:CRP-like cAMP-binding protein
MPDGRVLVAVFERTMGIPNHPAPSPAFSNRLLSLLPREALQILASGIKDLTLARGALLFNNGERIERVYFPHGGMVSLQVTTEQGNMIETGTIGREGAVGLQTAFGMRVAFSRASVQIAGRFSVISAERLELAANQHPEIKDLAFRYTEAQWAEAQQIAACNAVHTADARLCRWLLQAAERVDYGDVPLTQEMLADMLGVRRTTVTLLAQELQERGIVSYSRGHIKVIDRTALEQRACECYRVLKSDTFLRKFGIADHAGKLRSGTANDTGEPAP